MCYPFSYVLYIHTVSRELTLGYAAGRDYTRASARTHTHTTLHKNPYRLHPLFLQPPLHQCPYSSVVCLMNQILTAEEFSSSLAVPLFCAASLLISPACNDPHQLDSKENCLRKRCNCNFQPCQEIDTDRR